MLAIHARLTDTMVTKVLKGKLSPKLFVLSEIDQINNE